MCVFTFSINMTSQLTLWQFYCCQLLPATCVHLTGNNPCRSLPSARTSQLHTWHFPARACARGVHTPPRQKAHAPAPRNRPSCIARTCLRRPCGRQRDDQSPHGGALPHRAWPRLSRTRAAAFFLFPSFFFLLEDDAPAHTVRRSPARTSSWRVLRAGRGSAFMSGG